MRSSSGKARAWGAQTRPPGHRPAPRGEPPPPWGPLAQRAGGTRAQTALPRTEAPWRARCCVSSSGIFCCKPGLESARTADSCGFERAVEGRVNAQGRAVAARTRRLSPPWGRGSRSRRVSAPGPRGDPRGPKPALSASLHTPPGSGACRRVWIPPPFLLESCLDFCHRDAHFGDLEVLSSLPKSGASVPQPESLHRPLNVSAVPDGGCDPPLPERKPRAATSRAGTRLPN